MDPEYSTLLIDDYVLPDTGSELRAAEMDILMWLHTAGLERTVSQWKSLFSQVGLELVQIWSSPGATNQFLKQGCADKQRNFGRYHEGSGSTYLCEFS